MLSKTLSRSSHTFLQGSWGGSNLRFFTYSFFTAFPLVKRSAASRATLSSLMYLTGGSVVNLGDGKYSDIAEVAGRAKCILTKLSKSLRVIRLFTSNEQSTVVQGKACTSGAFFPFFLAAALGAGSSSSTRVGAGGATNFAIKSPALLGVAKDNGRKSTVAGLAALPPLAATASTTTGFEPKISKSTRTLLVLCRPFFLARLSTKVSRVL
mmetsp:Transcript_47001/g.100759  ORF Transcript_47001/g.100759 Transcript_47001/m.100759 type:complete len:210 (-) Transcript_47001:80-709(-)